MPTTLPTRGLAPGRALRPLFPGTKTTRHSPGWKLDVSPRGILTSGDGAIFPILRKGSF